MTTRDRELDAPKIDPNSGITGILSGAIGLIMPDLVQHLSPALGLAAESIARAFGMSPAQAQTAKEAVTKYGALGLNYSKEIYSVGKLGYDAEVRRREVLKAFAPTLAMEEGAVSTSALMRSKNEVLQLEMKRITGHLKNDLLVTGIGLTNAAVRHGLGVTEIAPGKKNGKTDPSQNKKQTTPPPKKQTAASGADDEHTAATPSDSEEAKKASLMMLMRFLGLVSGPIQSYVESKGKQELSEPTTGDLIRIICDQAEKGGDLGEISFGRRQGYMRLEEALMKIFKHHEHLTDGVQIDNRWRHNDDLQRACKMIAQSITSGELPPSALVSIVGNHMVLTPAGKVVDEQGVARVIEDMKNMALRADPKAVDQYLANLEPSPHELYQSLSQLPEGDRAVLMSFIPGPALERIGFSDAAIEHSNRVAQKEFSEHFQAILEDFGALSLDELKEMGLKEREAKDLKKFIAGVGKMEPEALRDALHSAEGAHAKESILNTLGNEKFWTERVKRREQEQERVGVEANADDNGEPLSHAARLGGEHRRKLSSEEVDAMPRFHADRDAAEEGPRHSAKHAPRDFLSGRDRAGAQVPFTERHGSGHEARSHSAFRE